MKQPAAGMLVFAGALMTVVVVFGVDPYVGNRLHLLFSWSVGAGVGMYAGDLAAYVHTGGAE